MSDSVTTPHCPIMPYTYIIITIDPYTCGYGIPSWDGHRRQARVAEGHLHSKRLLIESRWVSKLLAFAGELRPRRLNN
jgi:hypothetical protein